MVTEISPERLFVWVAVPSPLNDDWAEALRLSAVRKLSGPLVGGVIEAPPLRYGLRDCFDLSHGGAQLVVSTARLADLGCRIRDQAGVGQGVVRQVRTAPRP